MRCLFGGLFFLGVSVLLSEFWCDLCLIGVIWEERGDI